MVRSVRIQYFSAQNIIFKANIHQLNLKNSFATFLNSVGNFPGLHFTVLDSISQNIKCFMTRHLTHLKAHIFHAFQTQYTQRKNFRNQLKIFSSTSSIIKISSTSLFMNLKFLRLKHTIKPSTSSCNYLARQ